MARSIRVAAVQVAAHDRDAFARTLDTVVDAAARAAREADLIVLPEATFPAYVLGHAPLETREIDDGIERLRAVARETRTVLVAGAALRRDGRTYNAAVAIDADGSVAGYADKLFLWHFDRRWFARGDRLAPVRTRAGLLGMLVCADGRLPTIARALVDDGAEVLVMPTAWVTTGRDPNALENVQADLLARVRAYENGVPFIAANKCGSELGMVAYCGKSQIVDEGGELLALASQHHAETLHATVALTGGKRRRATLAQPVARAKAPEATRIAISYEPLPGDVDARLELLDDAHALSPHDAERLVRLDAEIGAAFAGDDEVLDPGGLVPYQLAGLALICWTTDLPPPWLKRIARARALELRLYIVVFARSERRAFAVDPDGTIVAGTFGEFRLASFAFDPRKTEATLVAPGTDIREGLERVAAVVARGPAVT